MLQKESKLINTEPIFIIFMLKISMDNMTKYSNKLILNTDTTSPA